MNSFAETAYDSLIIAGRELALVFRGRKGLPADRRACSPWRRCPAMVRAIGNTGSNAETFQRAQIAAMMRFFPRDVVRYLHRLSPAADGRDHRDVVLSAGLRAAHRRRDDRRRHRFGRDPILGRARRARWPGAGQGARAVGNDLRADPARARPHLGDLRHGPGRHPAGVLRWGPRLYLLSCAAAMVPVSFVILLGVSASHPRWVTDDRDRRAASRRGSAAPCWPIGSSASRPGCRARSMTGCSPHSRARSAAAIALVLGWSALFMGAAVVIFRRRSL